MHGLGNDYVFIDAFPPETNALLTQTDLPALARAVSDRHSGVGFGASGEGFVRFSAFSNRQDCEEALKRIQTFAYMQEK